MIRYGTTMGQSGRIGIPQFSVRREPHMHCLLVEMDRAEPLDEEKKALDVYMDQTLVHLALESAYVFSLHEKGRVPEGFDRTS